MSIENPKALIAELKNRPPRRNGPALGRIREIQRQAVGSARLEGFEPTDLDRDALDLLATGRITKEEYLELCRKIAAFKTRT